MIRNVDLSKVTDNRLYTKKDIVNISCDGCKGCSDCCKSVGDSIILDPFDMYNLSKATGKSFEALMEDVIEIRLIDNLILPNIMIDEEKGCKMLDENGRCTIHALRPGFCRLFPLGRLYDDNGDFKYILQIHECDYTPKGPALISDWIGIDDLDKYEAYIKRWHAFTKMLGEYIKGLKDTRKKEHFSWLLIRVFFEPSYDTNKVFYSQFEERLASYEENLKSVMDVNR